MNKNIESMIKELNSAKEEFYKEAIPLHNNKELQEIIGTCLNWPRIGLTNGKASYEKKLYYGKEGFILDSPECTYAGDMGESSRYSPQYSGYIVQKGRLYCSNVELLETFKDMNMKKIESAIESELKKLLKDKQDIVEYSKKVLVS